MTITEASLRTGIPKRTLLRKISHGDLKAHKLGTATTAWIINQADLDDYLARREAASA